MADNTGTSGSGEAKEVSNAWKGFVDLFSGTVAGMVGKVVEFPFDTVKVRLQTQDLQNPKYSGAIDCLKKTVNNEGVRGLYKGMASPVVGAMMENAVLFATYGQFRKMLQTSPDEELSLGKMAIAGAGSGFCVSFVLTPVELIKCRLQIQSDGGLVKYKGPIDCLMKTMREEGLARGLYKGHFGTLLRETPGNAAWFGTYELFCKLMTPKGKTKDDLSAGVLMAAGALGGMSYWGAFFPADVVKSRIQTMEGTASFGAVFKHVLEKEGVKGLYRGFGTTMVRAVPANATIFATYEVVARYLNEM